MTAIVVMTSLRSVGAEPVRVGVDVATRFGGHVEAFDFKFAFSLGVALRRGPWQAAASVIVHPHIASDKPLRDTELILGLGGAARLSRDVRLWRGSLSLGAGIVQLWLVGSGQVQRLCSETRKCVAGHYNETPSYWAWAPELHIGYGFKLGRVVHLRASAIIQSFRIYRPPPNPVRGVTAVGELTFNAIF